MGASSFAPGRNRAEKPIRVEWIDWLGRMLPMTPIFSNGDREAEVLADEAVGAILEKVD
jgi:hypothetical protein